MQRRSLRLAGIAVALSVLAVVLIGAASVSGQPAAFPSQPLSRAMPPTYRPYYGVTVPQGVPAITPRGSLANSTGPHFTNRSPRL